MPHVDLRGRFQESRAPRMRESIRCQKDWRSSEEPAKQRDEERRKIPAVLKESRDLFRSIKQLQKKLDKAILTRI